MNLGNEPKINSIVWSDIYVMFFDFYKFDLQLMFVIFRLLFVNC